MKAGTSMRLPVRALSLALVCWFAAACASSVNAGSDYRPDYAPTVRPFFEIGEIMDETAHKQSVDIPALMKTALREKFAELSIPVADDTADADTDVIVINATVLNYRKGNAIGRWLIPGVAPTKLDVSCELIDRRSDRTVGTIFAKGSAKGGGLYSIGAWKYIFSNVAEQIGLQLVEKYKPLPPPSANDHVEPPDAQLVNEL